MIDALDRRVAADGRAVAGAVLQLQAGCGAGLAVAGTSPWPLFMLPGPDTAQTAPGSGAAVTRQTRLMPRPAHMASSPLVLDMTPGIVVW